MRNVKPFCSSPNGRKATPSTRDARVEAHIDLLYQLAHQLMRHQPVGVELEDLVQECAVAILIAAQTYDPAKGAPTTYYVSPVRVAMVRFIQRMRGVFWRARQQEPPVSLAAPFTAENKTVLYEVTCDHAEAARQARRLQAWQLLQIIETTLPVKQEHVVLRRAAGDTFEEIGADLGVSRQWAHVLHEDAEIALAKQRRAVAS